MERGISVQLFHVAEYHEPGDTLRIEQAIIQKFLKLALDKIDISEYMLLMQGQIRLHPVHDYLLPQFNSRES